MAEKTRWGILATGSIANKFATGLQVVPQARIQAVGSRSLERAEEFAEKYEVPNRHGSYGELVRDPDVDVIYVATPHPFHCENTIMALEAGKPVLCEKPFALNADEAERMIECARERSLFLMEAMWTRFLPTMCRLRELIDEGALGEVRMLEADFGFRSRWNPEGRLLNPELGGGCLLDVGVYPLALAFMVFGAPREVSGLANLGETGVDEQAAWVLSYDGGEVAICSSAVRTLTFMEAKLCGTERRVRLHRPWWSGTKMTLYEGDEVVEELELPKEGNGMGYEARAVGECLREGRTQHPLMPLDETLEIMRTMDELRSQWGLSYPMEQ